MATQSRRLRGPTGVRVKEMKNLRPICIRANMRSKASKKAPTRRGWKTKVGTAMRKKDRVNSRNMIIALECFHCRKSRSNNSILLRSRIMPLCYVRVYVSTSVCRLCQLRRIFYSERLNCFLTGRALPKSCIM